MIEDYSDLAGANDFSDLARRADGIMRGEQGFNYLRPLRLGDGQEQYRKRSDTGGMNFNYNFDYDPYREAIAAKTALEQAEADYEANKLAHENISEQYAREWASMQGEGGSTIPARYTPNSGSDFGKSAYGFGGVATGQKHQKGSAPYGFQPQMWNALQAAFNDMEKAGLGRPRITDGWRSYDLQVKTKAAKGNLAATPGNSVHGLGYAADLALNKKQQKWMEANGIQYGLARLPSESWHWQLMPQFVNSGQQTQHEQKREVIDSRKAADTGKPLNRAYASKAQVVQPAKKKQQKQTRNTSKPVNKGFY